MSEKVRFKLDGWMYMREDNTVNGFKIYVHLRISQLKVRSVDDTFRNDAKRYVYTSAYIVHIFS